MRLFKDKFQFLQPLAYMFKDFKDTFKPYKSSYYLQRDLIQPLRGLKNIILGIVFIIHGLGTLDGNLFLSGFTSIFRGITQIVTTPLTWVIRTPLRALITAITGYEKAEDGKGIQTQVQIGKSLIEPIEEYNSGVVIMNAFRKRKEEAQEILETPYLEEMSGEEKAKRAQAALTLRSNDELVKAELNNKMLRNELWPKATHVANTILEKYMKARVRGQRTDLEHVRAFNITESDNLLQLSNFKDGLKLFEKKPNIKKSATKVSAYKREKDEAYRVGKKK